MKESKQMVKAEMSAMKRGGASKRVMNAEATEMKHGGKVMGYAQGGAVGKFKPCSACKNAAACAKAGKCMMKSK
jgi:hypothetical protein